MNNSRNPFTDTQSTAEGQQMKVGLTKDLNDLFFFVLAETYGFEQRLLKFIPKWQKALHDEELQHLLSQHQNETSANIAAIERAFEVLQKPPFASTSLVLDGLLSGSSNLMEDFHQTQAVDATFAHVFREILHAKIMRYEDLLSWAQILGLQEIVALIKALAPSSHKSLTRLKRLSDSRIDILASEQNEAAGDVEEGNR